jgi:repressor LexA
MPLTPRQQQVYDFIQLYIKEHSHSPSHAELMRHFQWKSLGTVQDMLNAIQRRGYLSREKSTAHSLTLAPLSSPSLPSSPPQVWSSAGATLPILGQVAAGRPLESYSHQEELNVPSQMLKGSGDFYILKVAGDSMLQEGILDGDHVIVRKQSAANNGDIVVAFIDDGASIKKFFQKKSKIELHSANPKYSPLIITPKQNFRIEGVYCGLMRF